MNVILSIQDINWRPRIRIPEEYQFVFQSWIDVSNKLIDLRDSTQPGTPRHNELMDYCCESIELSDKCKRIIISLTEQYGWYIGENRLFKVVFRMEENHPYDSMFPDNDYRPICWADHYRTRMKFAYGTTIDQLIKQLQNIPPNWTNSGVVTVSVANGEFRIEGISL